MLKRHTDTNHSRDGIDRILDRVEANSQRWNKAKPFFPTLTKFLLILGLGFLSWLATYTGILELIIANSGDINFSYRIAIAFAVAMLMLMIIYLLDSLFSPLRWWLRVLYITGYLFLTLISVGFGFGFYWKFLESRAEATRSAESAVGQVQTSLQTGQTRLEQLLTTLTALTALSKQKAEQEHTKGGTCPASPPGDGPRRRLRDADAKNFQFAGDFVDQRVGTVKADIEALNLDMAKIVSRDTTTVDPISGTRNKYLRGMSRKLDGTVARFNAFRTDPQLKQFRQNFSERASRTVFSNGKGGTFRCPDPQLQNALRGVVRAIDELPDLSKPQIAAVEGSEAIVEAFRRLTTTTIGLMTFKLPPSPDELRSLQQKAVQSVQNPSKIQSLQVQAGLGERDYIPLFIAIFVDFCILLVSVNRPVNRLQGLVSAAREASNAEVHQVLDHFHRVHQGKRSERLDIFHDVMFDNNWGDQLIAVPLDIKPEEQSDKHNDKLVKARYLSTLLVALEETGLVSRKPLFRTSAIKKQLKKLNSPYADSDSFRVYRFLKGAWSAIVLDDVLGASAKLSGQIRNEDRYAAVDQMFDNYYDQSLDPTQEPPFSDQESEPDHTYDKDRENIFTNTHNSEPSDKLNSDWGIEQHSSGTSTKFRDENDYSSTRAERTKSSNSSESELSELNDSIIDIKSRRAAPRAAHTRNIKITDFDLEDIQPPELPTSDQDSEVIILDSKVVSDPIETIEIVIDTEDDTNESDKLSKRVDLGENTDIHTEQLRGNRYLASDLANASTEDVNNLEAHSRRQVVQFPKLGELDNSDVQTNFDQVPGADSRIHVPANDINSAREDQNSLASKLSQEIWNKPEELDWQRPEEIEFFEDSDDTEYEWDQPDIQSEKIAARFAAKNEKS